MPSRATLTKRTTERLPMTEVLGFLFVWLLAGAATAAVHRRAARARTEQPQQPQPPQSVQRTLVRVSPGALPDEWSVRYFIPNSDGVVVYTELKLTSALAAAHVVLSPMRATAERQ
jgi:hypothetical protein